MYYLAGHPRVQLKLQKELDEQLGTEDEIVSNGQQVKRTPYLDACINEALRLHSPSAIGLPRVVAEGGLTIFGHYFPEGTILSVPSYSIHRDKRIWGDDVEIYRPERWFERNQADMQKTLNIFSVGPRQVTTIKKTLNSEAITSLELVLVATWHSWNFRSSLVPSCEDIISSLRKPTKRLIIPSCSFFFFPTGR